MIVWFFVTVLLLWNAIYCLSKIIADFRGPRPESGVWGLFALAGVLSAIAMASITTLLAFSGV